MKETLRWSPPITRLGVRIFDLSAEGYSIIERGVSGRNFSEYKLIPTPALVMPPAFDIR